MLHRLSFPLAGVVRPRRVKRSLRQLDDVLRDPHLARDLGFPPRVPQRKSDSFW